MLTYYFLYINNKWLSIGQDDLYNIAIDVATSNPLDKQKILELLNMKFKESLVDKDSIKNS